MNRFIAIVSLLSFAAFGDGPSPVTKTRLGSLHPREGLVVTDIDLTAIGGGVSGTTSEITDGTNTITADGTVSITEEYWEYTGSWTEGEKRRAHGKFPRWTNPDDNNLEIYYVDGSWYLSGIVSSPESLNEDEGEGENATALSYHEGNFYRKTETIDDKIALKSKVNDMITSATNGLATVSDVESKADKATTLAGYGITDAVPLVEDVNGEKTAVTIGSRAGTVGPYSLANGNNVTASGQGSHAEGLETVASGVYSRADGMFTEALGPGSYALGYMTKALPSHRHAFVWNGYGAISEKYPSNGEGTFNINPINGAYGFYIGDKTLSETISDGVAGKADTTNVYTKAEVDAKVENSVLPTNPTFSNAVLSVGLNIDTNSVAVLNEIAETFGGFPIGGTATTVGGLLAALAAAIAWLKKNKVGSFESVGGASATVENGVAKLDDFFTESNSLLTATIDARLPYPINAVSSTGVLKDRAINTTSLASVTVPDNFTDLLIRASVASSLSVTMPEAIATKYGDTFPGDGGEYLVTITKTGASEAYVRTIKLEEVA